MDIWARRVSFPAMRAAVRTLAVSCALAWGGIGSTGCIPDENKEPEWRKPPEGFDPKKDELTFGTKNLDVFNTMSSSERKAHVEALQAKPGSFKGQARFQRVTELGEKMDDRALGQYEAYATVEDPVLYEITIEYHLFADDKIGHGFPPGTFVEFTGTLADLTYSDEAKPRKLVMKVKDAKVERLDL